ncbi:MAG: Mur ligase domain-containing protein [Ilumatobacteraceae bacterium]
MSVTVMAEISRHLIEAIPTGSLVETIGDVDAVAGAIVDLTHDSRDVGEGWAFACVPGDTHDGHDFAAGAVDAGATLLIVQRRLPLDVAQLVVTDVRRVAWGHWPRACTAIRRRSSGWSGSPAPTARPRPRTSSGRSCVLRG